MKCFQGLFVVLSVLVLAACSGSSDDTEGQESASGACVNMCTAASFTSGVEENFGGDVIECQCSGTGDGLSQSQCTTYCADFNINEDNAFLTTENSANDKCVCDGTGG